MEQNNTVPTEHSHAPKTLIKIGITQGDPNGVGLELILKAFSDPTMFDLCLPVVFGSAKIAAYHRKALGLETNFNIINSAEEAQRGHLNLVNCYDKDFTTNFGHNDPEAGHVAYVALEAATEALKNGLIDALVTAPICKAAIQSADFRFAGHTEYLCNRLGHGEQPLMILANSMMRVALATTHLSLAEVAGALTQELIEEKITLLSNSLRHDFLVPAPRIAVLGLNPHNGDNGTMGEEEKTIIAPAIAAATSKGINAFGPYPADGFFGSGAYAKFDGILAMYHDQGLTPLKTLSMDDGINFTAGLPYVRTSPDHGTAFDIAGQGIASEGSLRAAIYAAIDLYRNREADREAYKNPLPKLYHERREETGRGRFAPQSQPQSGE